MKEFPILFSAPMVQAILAGRKSQTRRVSKLPKKLSSGDLSRALPDKMFGVTPGLHIPMPDESVQRLRNPWGWPEPCALWVRETFCLENTYDYHGDHVPPKDRRPIQKHEYGDVAYWLIPHYRATEPEPHIVPYRCDADDDKTRWTPSIFMPRWASRITLEVIDVRAERLQDISEEDAFAEGVTVMPCKPSRAERMGRDAYQKLWESIHGPGTWDKATWVWVISFKCLDIGETQ